MYIYATVFIIVCIIGLVVFFLFRSNPTKMLILNNNKLKTEHHANMKRFEKKLANWYPLGDDFFRIDHGINYYEFFERLGDVNFGVCLDNKKRVVGTACAIKRYVDVCNTDGVNGLNGMDRMKRQKIWYLCDLKIDKAYRGQHITFKMLKLLGPKIGLDGKIYGISMNGSNENRALKLAKRIPLINFESSGTLLIFSLDYDTAVRVLPIVKKHRGYTSFISLVGIKDLILKSTNKPKKICHFQWYPCGTFANAYTYPQKDHTHMLCCLQNDPMAKELKNNNITTNVTATIISANMHGCDWKFILTSDI